MPQSSHLNRRCVLPQTGYQYLSLYRNTPGDKSQRTIHYAITGSTRFVYAAAIRVFILKVRDVPKGFAPDLSFPRCALFGGLARGRTCCRLKMNPGRAPVLNGPLRSAAVHVDRGG